MIARWQLYAITTAAFVAGLLGIRAHLLASGEARLRDKIQKANADAQRAAQEIRNEVDALGPDDLKSRARVWVRGADR